MFHGANLVPENLETGEFKVGATGDVSGLSPVYVIGYSHDTIKIQGAGTTVYSCSVETAAGEFAFSTNGIPTSIYYICCTTLAAYKQLMQSLHLENQSEYVVAAFTIPDLATTGIRKILSANVSNMYVLAGNATPTSLTLTSTPTTLDGYTPKNAKLRQYPYLYLGYNPIQGTSKVYRYEDFTSGTPSFKIVSEVNPNPTVNFIPQNYRGKSGDSLSDVVSLNGYPQLSQTVDVYNSWLAENSGIINVQTQQAEVNKILGFLSAGSSMSAGIASDSGEMSGVGTAISGAFNVAQNYLNYEFYIAMVNAQKEKQALLPDNVSLGGSNATLLGYDLMDNNVFTRYTVKYQYAKRIDDFFSMYGYQTNELKVPAINNRPKWNYVKTLGLNIIGNIPQEDMQKFKNIFDNGVTLWHDTSHFLDYSQTNK